MEIKKLNSEENKVSFILSKSNSAFANTIRRIMMEEVPTLAIEDVHFIKNDSALYDEFVAHRLGLVVLKTDLKSMELKESCSCKDKGCAKCEIKFKLDKEGPGMVYASDIKFNDKSVKAIYPKTPIVNLLKKQSLKIEGIAILGKGKEHMKWSPGLVYYRLYPEIKIEKCDRLEEVERICPKKVYRVSNKKLIVDNLINCDLCMACSEICEDIKVEGKKDEFIFNIESWGQIEIKEMLNKCIDVFNEKLKDFEDKL